MIDKDNIDMDKIDSKLCLRRQMDKSGVYRKLLKSLLCLRVYQEKNNKGV